MAFFRNFARSLFLNKENECKSNVFNIYYCGRN